MSERVGGTESLMDTVNGKLHCDDYSTSSSDSDNDKPLKNNRLLGRQKPVHTVLGGGKSADIILWRNKQISAAIVVSVTIVWLLFEWIGYHLLPLICHSLILCLAVLFCWSKVSCAINRTMPKFPEVILPEDLTVSIALSIRNEINRAFATLKEVASGRDIKQFFTVLASLWVVSVIGSWFTLLTLFYLVFVILHTVPFLYEKHEDAVDNYARKAMVEIKKQYKVLDAKVLQKIPFNKKQL